MKKIKQLMKLMKKQACKKGMRSKKKEWLEDYREDTLDEFEERFTFAQQMIYQEDDEDFDEFHESFRKYGLSKRSF